MTHTEVDSILESLYRRRRLIEHYIDGLSIEEQATEKLVDAQNELDSVVDDIGFYEDYFITPKQ